MTNKKDEFVEEDVIHEEDLDQSLDAVSPVQEEAVKMTADVPVQVVAVLGKKTISMKELINLKLGGVIDLARPVGEMVDLVASGKLIAKGELVDVDGKLGVRVVKMVR